MTRRNQSQEDFFPDEIPERYRKCTLCRYWIFDEKNKGIARIDGATREVGQCTGAEDSSNGPVVEGMTKGQAVVCSEPNGCCAAFVPTADVMAEWEADANDSYYRDLDDDLARDGWFR